MSSSFHFPVLKEEAEPNVLGEKVQKELGLEI